MHVHRAGIFDHWSTLGSLLVAAARERRQAGERARYGC
jgi:hypothetical protein